MTRSTTPISLRAGLLALALCGLAPWAHADIFLCIDAQGRKELTDSMRPGCKPLDIPGNIPAPKGKGGAAKAPVATPANFPKVDNAQQKARDADRRDILNQERYKEQKKLDDMKKAYNNGEPERMGNEKNYAKYQERVNDMRADIARSEKNIEALDRELGTIK